MLMYILLAFSGSSPRMRGTHNVDVHLAGIFGIIPAYAGNTCDDTTLGEVNGDHPRVCGEHRKRRNDCSKVKGSSPRMRGTRVEMVLRQISSGIIPAYAGNTPPLTLRRPTTRDHPRVCGEHHRRRFRPRCPAGSSPRMRGTLLAMVSATPLAGIIPAYAGNTAHSSAQARHHQDHPRVCGEHDGGLQSGWCCMGSSPRMRGTPLVWR